MFTLKGCSGKIAFVVVFDDREQDVVIAQHRWAILLQMLLGQATIARVHVQTMKHQKLHRFAVVLQNLQFLFVKLRVDQVRHLIPAH